MTLSVTAADSRATAPDGPTGKLCHWVHSLSLEDVPKEAQARAKCLILDGIACLLVGAHLPWSETAAKGVLGMEGSGTCTVFGWDRVRWGYGLGCN